MFDIIVIGGGPGGYVAAVRAAQLGLKTALAEKAELGGVCLNRGCIPTKSLLHAASVMRNIRTAGASGIKTAGVELELRKVMAHKEKQIKALTGGVQYLLNKNGVTLFRGEADILSPDTVGIDGQKIRGRHIVIAVGSSSLKPKIPGIESSDVLTSDGALALESLPESMVIIGGGAIGIEMAFAFQSFGCQTTIVEMEPRLAPLMDTDISKGLEDLLKKQGVRVLTGARVEEIKKDTVVCSAGDASVDLPAKKTLVAAGRVSNGLMLSLDRLGLAHAKGVIQTDTYLKTNIPNIFAIGDVNGNYMLAHVASAEGVRAVENIAGFARPMDYSAVPQCIYTEPEAAAVGLTEAEAAAVGYAVQTSRVPVASNGKSMIEGCTSGFAKMIAEKSTGRILGAHILAPHASELITQCTAAVRFKATSKELLEIIYPHPSVSELLSEAVRGVTGGAIHI